MRCFAGTNALAADPADRWHGLAKEFVQAGNVDEAIACYRQALAINPHLADGWAELGLACFNHGQPREAVEAWQKSLDISPAQPQVLNNLASALTTATDPALHNGAKAVALAEQANQLTAGGNPIILSTLAAAYADGGRFAEAVATARQALAQAEARKDINLANALRDAIQRYSTGRQTGETK
jgi:tetratricopeptide (TPR) repeat protein